jgi:hypothetical protein
MKQKINVAIQTYNLEKERHDDCLSCGEDIRHPICPSCIAKGFNQWIEKFPEHEKIIEDLNMFISRHKKIKGKSKSCVSCGGEVHVCPYCFTSYLYKLIKEAKMGVKAMSEFLFLFNFDFEHKGYYKDRELYEGY